MPYDSWAKRASAELKSATPSSFGFFSRTFGPISQTRGHRRRLQAFTISYNEIEAVMERIIMRLHFEQKTRPAHDGSTRDCPASPKDTNLMVLLPYPRSTFPTVSHRAPEIRFQTCPTVRYPGNTFSIVYYLRYPQSTFSTVDFSHEKELA